MGRSSPDLTWISLAPTIPNSVTASKHAQRLGRPCSSAATDRFLHRLTELAHIHLFYMESAVVFYLTPYCYPRNEMSNLT